MSFSEVNELRKSGKLDEALAMASEDLATDPENIWNKRSIAWVHYEFLKKYASKEHYDEFKNHLVKIVDLDLPESENILFEQCAWQIGKLVYDLSRSIGNYATHLSIQEVMDKYESRGKTDIFQIIKHIPFTKPHPSYSFLYKAFHKEYLYFRDYTNFAEWWDFDHFLPEDFIKEEFNDIKIMSIGEQAYIAYSKKLLEGEPFNPFSFQKEPDKSKIHSFLPKLESVIESYPNLQYPSYYLAKLQLALNEGEDVLNSFIPFAKKRKNEFWVWTLMAEIHEHDPELQFACYCKALSLGTEDEYVIKVRPLLIEMLIKKNLYDEAKTEIDRIIKTSDDNGWKLSRKVTNWLWENWYSEAKALPNNQDFYLKYAKKADEILYQNIPEEIVAVEFVNSNRNILNFVKNKNHSGFFNYSDMEEKPNVGDILAVRFNGPGREGFHSVLSVKKLDPDTKCDAIKDFTGTLSINQGQEFGFIDNIFVDPTLINKMKLSDGQHLSGKAIMSFNKKRNEWGWKAVQLVNN